MVFGTNKIFPKAATLAPRNKKQPSPVYTDTEELPTVDINAGFANLSLSAAPQAPDVNLTIAHLKLLEAFHSLKQDIGYTDGLFDFWDSRANKHLKEVSKDAILSKIREKRWALYIARAADRFDAWWSTTLCVGNQRLELRDMMRPGFKEAAIIGTPLTWAADMLPPLGKFWHYKSKVCP